MPVPTNEIVSEPVHSELQTVAGNSLTIANILEKYKSLVGKDYYLPKTKHKGNPGTFLEELLGIPHTSNCLDCLDGELKAFPVKTLKNGKCVPKETIAVTMLSTNDIRIQDFKSSKCYKKMRKMVLAPYFRDGDTIRFMNAKLVELDNPEFTEICNLLESDYNQIRNDYIESGVLKSETGVLLQNRTKGAGHGSTSRAFYLRTEFMKRLVPLSLQSGMGKLSAP